MCLIKKKHKFITKYGSIQNGVLLGGQLAANIPLNRIAVGGSQTVAIPWSNIPNPADYGFTNEPWHFCLLARIESSTDDMSFPETTILRDNILNNNNIALRNLSIVQPGSSNSGNSHMVRIGVSNAQSENMPVKLEFTSDNDTSGVKIDHEARIKVQLDNILYSAWQSGGMNSTNFINDPLDQSLIVNDSVASLDSIILPPHTTGTVLLNFNFLVENDTPKNIFQYQVIQIDEHSHEIIGGESFTIEQLPRIPFYADAGSDVYADIGDVIHLSATNVGESASYVWSEPNTSNIYLGEQIDVVVDDTVTLALTVEAASDGFISTDEMQIFLKPSRLLSIVTSVH
jgi:hypothetical protein